jgi:hypothetical protein
MFIFFSKYIKYSFLIHVFYFFPNLPRFTSVIIFFELIFNFVPLLCESNEVLKYRLLFLTKPISFLFFKKELEDAQRGTGRVRSWRHFQERRTTSLKQLRVNQQTFRSPDPRELQRQRSEPAGDIQRKRLSARARSGSSWAGTNYHPGCVVSDPRSPPPRRVRPGIRQGV